jgi:hypothetical protein
MDARVKPGHDTAPVPPAEPNPIPPLTFAEQPREATMAEGGGGIGVLGVLVGALIVILVGGGILFATGNLGGSKTTVLKVEVPKITK